MFLSLFKTNKYFLIVYNTFLIYLLFIIIAFNRLSRDYKSYQLMFENMEYRNTLENGYQLLVNFLLKYDKNHETILFLSALFFVIVLLKYAKLTDNLSIIIFGYAGYTLIYDITQTRNLIMYLLVILSLKFVSERKPISFVVTILIATQFHALAAFYLPFYVISGKQIKKYERNIIFLTGLLIIFSPIAIKLFTLIVTSKASYATRTPGNGIFINYIFVIIDIVTVWLVKQFSRNSIKNSTSEMETYYKFTWYSMLILPFSSYFLEIIRIQRNAQLIKYIYISNNFKYLKLKEKILILFIILFNVILAFVLLKITNNWDLVEYIEFNELKYKLDILF